MTIQTIKIKGAANAADRVTVVPVTRELVLQMDTNTLWRGDGATAGGVAIQPPAAATPYPDLATLWANT